MRKSIFIIYLFLFVITPVSGQKLAPGKYWVQFKDKNETPFSIDRPEEFLSKEAINRRQRFNIPVQEQDIPVVKKYIDSLYNLGLEILGTSKWFNSAIVASSDTTILSLINELEFVRNFDYFQASRILTGKTLSFIDYTKDIKLPGFHLFDSNTDYGYGSGQINLLNGKALHEMGYRGQGIKIALLDAGFYNVDIFEAFIHLWYDNRILAGKDFVNYHDSNLYRESAHGMSALSAIAAYMPGSLVGTAPEAEFLLLRTEDASSEFRIEEANWLMAAEYADSAGADIISTSLGYNEFNDSTMNYQYKHIDGKTALVTQAAEIAFSKGMIVIASAGNEGNKKWNKITPPSDGENVISVGSIDTMKILSSFSSRGPAWDGRIKPDVMAVGYGTAIVNSSGAVSKGYGTSFAAPQISGLAACLWQAYPHKSNKEIIQAIRESSDRYEKPDTAFGYGIPDFLIAFNRLFDYKDSNKKIWVSPNPFTEYFNLYFDIYINEIQIIDMYGKIIWIEKVNLKPYELKNILPAGLAPGIYMVLGKNNNDFRITRIIKQ